MNFTPLLYALAALGAVAFVAFSAPGQTARPLQALSPMASAAHA
jgi:hypothetical protein